MNPLLPEDQDQFFALLMALIISFVSGFISISKRIIRGHAANTLWVISEFLTAILCGYLMFYTYAEIEIYMPKWFTLPVAVAIAAHIGGRVFQEAEAAFMRKYRKFVHDRIDS